MTERTVQLGMTTYTDVNGERRIGQAGEQVNVADGDLKRFDKLNGGAPKDAPSTKRARPRKTT